VLRIPGSSLPSHLPPGHNIRPKSKYGGGGRWAVIPQCDRVSEHPPSAPLGAPPNFDLVRSPPSADGLPYTEVIICPPCRVTSRSISVNRTSSVQAIPHPQRRSWFGTGQFGNLSPFVPPSWIRRAQALTTPPHVREPLPGDLAGHPVWSAEKHPGREFPVEWWWGAAWHRPREDRTRHPANPTLSAFPLHAVGAHAGSSSYHALQPRVSGHVDEALSCVMEWDWLGVRARRGSW
jgi:hypothetical protein